MTKSLRITVAVASVGIITAIGIFQKQEASYKSRTTEISGAEAPNAMQWAQIDLRTGEYNPAARIEIQNQMRHQSSRTGALGLQWHMRGPDNVGGRTRAVIEIFGRPDTLLAGSVSGGLFYSYDGGGSWMPHEQFNNQDSSSSIISCIHQDTNTGLIYIGTGSSFDSYANSASIRWPGFGMYVSDDQGQTFRHLTSTTPDDRYSTAGESWLAINRIRTNSSGHIFAATDRALLVSRDGGETWENPVFVDPAQTIPNNNRCADVSIGKNDVVLASYYAGSVYLSEDGVNFGLVNDRGLPTGGTRTVCHVAPSNPDIMYVMFIDGNACLAGIYKTNNGGQTFFKLLEPHDAFTPMASGNSCQGVYDAALLATELDPNTIFIGGIQLWRFDGSLTRIATEGGSPPFQDVLENYVHADKHYFYQSPNDKRRVYVTSDGGISKTENRGNTWTGLNKGFITTQFYGITHFNGGGSVIGGTQDNGTLVVLGDNARDPNMAYSVFGNDGIDCDASQKMPIVFATSQNGLVVRADVSAGTSTQPPFAFFSDMNSGGPFNTVVKLWESTNDLTSKDSIVFSVEPTEFAVATGNGIVRTFNETFSPVQPAARVIQSSIIIRSSGMELTIDPAEPGSLIGDGTGSVVFNNDNSIDISVTFDQAPSENANLLVTYEEQFSANAVIILESENLRSLQGSYIFEHRLENELNPGDVVRIQDPVQSLLFSTGAANAGGGIRFYRNVLNAQELPTSPIGIPGITGSVTCVEITNNGDAAFIGTSGGALYRVSGLRNLYSSSDLEDIEVDNLFNFGGPITGIAIDRTNNDRVVVTGGGYGFTNRVRFTENSLAANPNFINVHGDLAPMPIYDAEFNVNDPNMVLLGTEFGIWATADITQGASTTWSNENNSKSYVPIYDIRQQWLPFSEASNTGVIYVGTHGRGIWESTSLVGIRDVAPIASRNQFVSDVKVFPNPVQGEGTISLESEFNGQVNVRIYDFQGRQVKEWKQPISSGNNRIAFNTMSMRSGSYFAVIENNGMKQTTKFIVMK